MTTRARATTRKKSEASNRVSKERTTGLSKSLPIDQVLSFQRTIGNQAVQRLLESREMQAKLAPSMVVQRTPDPVSIDHPVLLIAQETANTCWAASLAMLYNYVEGPLTPLERERQRSAEMRGGMGEHLSTRIITPQGAAALATPQDPTINFANRYAADATIYPPEYTQLARPFERLGLRSDAEVFSTSERNGQRQLNWLRDQLQGGPIAVRVEFVSQGTDHMIVLTGLQGDGTPGNTRVFYNDPWPVGQGAYAYSLFDAVEAADFRWPLEMNIIRF